MSTATAPTPQKRRARSELLAPLELACLNALWRLGEATVPQVRDALVPRHNLAYTTILTVLDRLARKGLVERQLTGRRFTYRPALSRAEARRAAFRHLIENYFDGSTADFLAFLREQSPPEENSGSSPAGLDTVLL